MIKEYKAQLIISSIVILLPMLWGIYILPVILLAAFWLAVVITAKDSKNKGQNPKILKVVFYIMPVLSLVNNGLFFLCVHKKISGVDATSVILSLMGILFIVIGNYLPKVKQNHTIGIKIRWTLKNEENWNVTHRFAGKLWFTGGIVMLSVIFMKQNLAIAVFLIDMIVMVVWPIVYSYHYYKKQLANGEVSLEDFKLTDGEKKMNKIVIVVIIVLSAFVAGLTFAGDYSVKVDTDSVSIHAIFWSDAEIKISEIASVELRESDNIGLRSFGYGVPGLYMGEFYNDEYGSYTRYSRGGCDTNIVIKTNEMTYVINDKTDELTKDIYEAILSCEDQ